MAMNDTFHVFKMAERLSPEQLVQSIQNGTIDPNIGQLVLNNKVKQKQQMEAAAQQAPQQPPIAEQNMAAATQQAPQPMAQPAPPPPLAQPTQQPFGMSGGGFVGYQTGGSIYGDPEIRQLRNLVSLRYGDEQRLDPNIAENYALPPEQKAKAIAAHNIFSNLDNLNKEQLHSVLDKGLDAPLSDLYSAKESTAPAPAAAVNSVTPGDAGRNIYETVPGVKMTSAAVPGAPLGYAMWGASTRSGEKSKGVLNAGRAEAAPTDKGIAALSKVAEYTNPYPAPDLSKLDFSGGIGSGGGGGGLKGYGDVHNVFNRDFEAAAEESRKKHLADLEEGDKETFGKVREKIKEQKGKLTKSDEQNMWLSLMKAGLATAGGKSQYAMQNIGEGGQQGINQYVQRDVINRELEEKIADRDQALELQEMAARKGNKAEAYQRARQAQAFDVDVANAKANIIGNENREYLQKAQMNQSASIARAQIGAQIAQMNQSGYFAGEKMKFEREKANLLADLKREEMAIQKVIDGTKSEAAKYQAYANLLKNQNAQDKIIFELNKATATDPAMEQQARLAAATAGPDWRTAQTMPAYTAQGNLQNVFDTTRGMYGAGMTAANKGINANIPNATDLIKR